MNTMELLNKYLYPGYMDNVVRKQFPYYSAVTMLTGVTEYFFFQTPPAPFVSNKQLPVAGTEVFFIEAISGYPVLNHITTAQIDSLNELLQQSFLEIIVDGRVQMKIPGMDFINYQYANAWSDQVVVTALQTSIGGNKNSDGFLGRKLPLPIIMNSQSSFSFRLVTVGDAVYNNIPFKLVLHGLQLDKLQSFEWDDLKSNVLQQIPWTLYNTVVIPSTNQTTYDLFANRATAVNLGSGTFPLSNIETFSCQAVEVLVNQPDVPIDPATIYNSRIVNELFLSIDDRIYYQGNLQNMLSVVAGFGQALTTTPNLDVVNMFNFRQQRILDVPINFPANGKVTCQLTQPGGSLGITGEITVALRGMVTRRVA
jgi:hypothetical protein